MWVGTVIIFRGDLRSDKTTAGLQLRRSVSGPVSGSVLCAPSGATSGDLALGMNGAFVRSSGPHDLARTPSGRVLMVLRYGGNGSYKLRSYKIFQLCKTLAEAVWLLRFGDV